MKSVKDEKDTTAMNQVCIRNQTRVPAIAFVQSEILFTWLVI